MWQCCGDKKTPRESPQLRKWAHSKSTEAYTGMLADTQRTGSLYRHKTNVCLICADKVEALSPALLPQTYTKRERDNNSFSLTLLDQGVLFQTESRHKRDYAHIYVFWQSTRHWNLRDASYTCREQKQRVTQTSQIELTREVFLSGMTTRRSREECSGTIWALDRSDKCYQAAARLTTVSAAAAAIRWSP